MKNHKNKDWHHIFYILKDKFQGILERLCKNNNNKKTPNKNKTQNLFIMSVTADKKIRQQTIK